MGAGWRGPKADHGGPPPAISPVPTVTKLVYWLPTSDEMIRELEEDFEWITGMTRKEFRRRMKKAAAEIAADLRYQNTQSGGDANG